MRARFFLTILILLAATSCTCLAQGTCDLAQHPLPCVYPIVVGNTQVTGLASRGKVDILINDRIVEANVKVYGGKFSSGTLNPIRSYDSVSVQKAGVSKSPGTSVISKAMAYTGVCNSETTGPCINQPYDGQTEITGRGDETLQVFISGDGLSDGITVTPDKKNPGWFSASVNPVSSYDHVMLKNPKDSAKTVGPVPVFMATASTKPACSKDAKVKPCINPIQQGPQSSQLSGYAEPNSTVDVKYGNTELQLKTGSDGQFQIALANLKEGDKVSVAEIPPPPTGAPQTSLRATVGLAGPPCTKDTKQKPCIVVPIEENASKVSGYAAAGSSVTVEYDGKSQTKTANPDGSFEIDLSGVSKGDQVSVTVSAPTVKPPQQATTTVAAATPTPAGTSSSLYTLGLVGINATGTSISGPKQQYFVTFDLSAPVPFLGRTVCPRHEPTSPLAQRCWLWLNPRLASAPAAASSAVSSFSAPNSLSSGISSQTVSQITQTFEFHAGFEYSLNQPYWGRQFGWGTSWARSTVFLIVGGGSSTPINSLSNASEFALNNSLGAQFTQNPALANTYPQLAQALCNGFGFTSTPPCKPSTVAYKNVAFVLPNRSRFYRDYFAGFRLRTYYFTGACKDADSNQTPESPSSACKVVNTYPGTFDVRLGQDETVTSGFLRGVVLTVAGTYPLPGTAGTVRVFGSTYFRLHKNQNTTALALVAPNPTVPITDPSVVIQSISASDQDYYRLGIGVDLIALISKWANPSKPGSTAQSTTQ
jgi:hypothetical protein